MVLTRACGIFLHVFLSFIAIISAIILTEVKYLCVLKDRPQSWNRQEQVLPQSYYADKSPSGQEHYQSNMTAFFRVWDAAVANIRQIDPDAG